MKYDALYFTQQGYTLQWWYGKYTCPCTSCGKDVYQGFKRGDEWVCHPCLEQRYRLMDVLRL